MSTDTAHCFTTEQGSSIAEYGHESGFTIGDLQVKSVPEFNSTIQTIKIDITTLPSRECFVSNLKRLDMKMIFERLTDGFNETQNDLISIKIITDTLEFEPSDNFFKPIDELDHRLLENLIENMAQSRTFDAGDSFEIRVTHVRKNHQPPEKCDRCKNFLVCTVTSTEKECSDCLRHFYGEQCYLKHLRKIFNKRTESVCDKNRKCPICEETYDSIIRDSGAVTRIRVDENVSDIIHNHKCYMPRLESTSGSDNDYDKSAFLFYDFEAKQETDDRSGKKLHEVNLCVAQLVCSVCFNCDSEENCKLCGKEQTTYVFRKDPVEELVSLVLNINLSARIEQLTCIAHFGQNYDAQFILKHIVKNTKIKPFLVARGSSILFMSFMSRSNLNIRFIDSYSYFDMKLAKLPETFGLDESTYKKGCFPHLFNTTQNQNYVGPLPGESFYGPGQMKVEELTEFRKWHKEQREKNYEFNFEKEIREYCLNDVEILRKACYEFRKMFIELCNIDPFVDGATMAAVCMKIFRTKFLKPKTIGIIPNAGYRRPTSDDALNPRDAFYGGRIEAYVAHRQIIGDEKIHHIDICSLYPCVNKYGKVPIGHPTVYVDGECQEITGEDNNLKFVEGLVKCTVLAPRELYHPVLPMHINNRMVFSLCRLCSENSLKADCPHDDERDREFTGTWVSDELKKAVEVGYTITRIHEIWQYKVKQYNREERNDGIFTDYVNTFLELKQSASGWPIDCRTSQDQRLYIDKYERREGITLKAEKMVKNPGLRFIAKRALNCLWGKFGQREFGNYEAMRDSTDLDGILNSPEKKLVNVEFADGKPIGYCRWMTTGKPTGKLSQEKNVVVAAYTTAQARLKLYGYLERLGDRVLYCHTDSCIYVNSVEKGQKEIETGSFLGDMTDELADKYGQGAYAREFVSCGSTLHSMIVVKPDGTEDTITKGVTIDTASKDVYSHENIKALALGERDKISHSSDAISPTKHHGVVTCERKKTCRTNFSKRRFASASESYPFGFKKSKNA